MPGLFDNPAIPGFHPDPSVCRVGDDFFLVTSSFEYFPGIPIFTSTDLVSWRQLGHVLDRESQLDLRNAPTSGGIYAPTIRWHDGMFFVTGTNVSGRGHFIVHSRDPAGPWSEPVWVDQNGIDPSLFFDDGSVYFTSNVEPDPSGAHVAQPDFQRGIQQCLVDPMTGERQSEVRFLWAGTGGKFPEGPHLYRRGDFYYLLISEGGTEYGHMATIARARTPWGPFEPSPDNPVLTHRSTASPIQATGHADLVELGDGSWWLVCLGVRPLGQWPRHHLGRETFLAPVEWTTDGWPRVGGSGLVELSAPRPPLAEAAAPESSPRDDFDTGRLGSQWNFLRVPTPSAELFDERPGWLALRGSPDTLDDMLPAFIGRRQQHFECTVVAALDFQPGRAGEEAGVTVRMNEAHHYEIGVRFVDGTRQLFVRRRIGRLVEFTPLMELPTGIIRLGITADRDDFHFGTVDDSGVLNDLVRGETKYLSSEVAGGFTGTYLGMYATGNGRTSTSVAWWDWFDYSVP